MLKHKIKSGVLIAGLALLSLQAVFSQNTENNVRSAKSTLMPTKGNSVTGEVIFTAVNDGVRVVANIQGLTPGDHGFHVHEFGDCSAPDASSAGAHFNPTNKHHGSPESEDRHVGDLGNITADENGKGHYDRVDKIIKLNGQNNIVGRSVIVHANADDFVTQPAGNAGAKVACGVIIAE